MAKYIIQKCGIYFWFVSTKINVFIARYLLDHSKDLPIARDFPFEQCWCILVLRLVLFVIACRTTAYWRFIANPISCSINHDDTAQTSTVARVL